MIKDRLISNEPVIYFYKFLRSLLESSIKFVLRCSPDLVNSKVASMGNGRLVRTNMNYLSKVDFTDFRILANSKYDIENGAHVSKFFKKSDYSYLGIAQIARLSRNCIDVGANAGTYSLVMSANCKGLVLSFEPSPHIFARLKANISLNNQQSRIIAKNYGLSDRDEKLKYYETRLPLGNAHLAAHLEELNFINKSHLIDSESEVECYRLDDLEFSKHYFDMQELDLIKVDIETMEYKFIRGAHKTIEKTLPAIICETQYDASYIRGEDVTSEIFVYLYGLGYKSYKIGQSGKFSGFIYPEFITDTYFLHLEHIEQLKEQIIEIGNR